MILWRISNYATLDGAGGLYVSGRWHTKGHPVVYCTLNPSTALLEILVHMSIDSEDLPDHFHVLKIEGSDALPSERIERDELPPNWEADIAVTQSIGDRWLSEKRSLLLEVPSVLVPETWNVLVNPEHPEVKQLMIVAVYNHPFDLRFLQHS
jgi:RES domain-containing protein